MADETVANAAPGNDITVARQQQYLSAITSGQWTPELLRVVRETVAKGADNAELAMFAHVCARTGLDPFTKQIHFTKRWDGRLKKDVAVIITGIDGFRVIAGRGDRYRGTVGPFWCGKDGVWKDVWLEDEHPFAAKVGVRHSSFDEPVWGIARWSASCPLNKEGQPSGLWRERDAEQLAKCAESLALRMAFPHDLSGLYTDVEMDKAREGDPEVVVEAPESGWGRELEAKVAKAAAAQSIASGVVGALGEAVIRGPELKPLPTHREIIEGVFERLYQSKANARGAATKLLAFVNALNDTMKLGLDKVNKLDSLRPETWEMLAAAAMQYEESRQAKAPIEGDALLGVGPKAAGERIPPPVANTPVPVVPGVLHEEDETAITDPLGKLVHDLRVLETGFKDVGLSRQFLIESGGTVWLIDSETLKLSGLDPMAARDMFALTQDEALKVERAVAFVRVELEKRLAR